MKRSFAHLLAAVLVAAAVALVAGAAPAQALTTCSAMTPCLPLSDGFTSVLPAGENATFVGSGGGLFGANNGSNGSAIQGNFNGGGVGAGVRGETSVSLSGDTQGVLGRVIVSNPAMSAAGVRGDVTATGQNGIGVLGTHGGSGFGVLGFASNGAGVVGASGNIGVVGAAPPAGLAGLFLGNLHVQGTLSKAAGRLSYRPSARPGAQVPAALVRGVAGHEERLRRRRHHRPRGFATVRLPRYFQALNRSFRYQLTIVGRSFAQAIVWKEIAANRFTIRTNQPRVKVSWQVTGIRKDRYANAHRIQPETTKPASEQGTYLAPELYGQPSSASAFKTPPVRNLVNNRPRNREGKGLRAQPAVRGHVRPCRVPPAEVVTL